MYKPDLFTWVFFWCIIGTGLFAGVNAGAQGLSILSRHSASGWPIGVICALMALAGAVTISGAVWFMVNQWPSAEPI